MRLMRSSPREHATDAPRRERDEDKECSSSKMEETSLGKRLLAIGSWLEEDMIGFTTMKDTLKEDTVVTVAVTGRCCCAE